MISKAVERSRWFEISPRASCTHAFCFYGGLAQLARALAWHARGHRFDPDILHDPLSEEEIFDILTQARL